MLPRTKFVAGLSAVLLVGGATASLAAIPDSDDGEIHACRQPATGNLRVIDAESGTTCHPSETELVWNQAGPQGPAGPVGADGAPGDSIEFRRVTSSPILAPAGTHVEYDVTCASDEVETGGGWDTGGYEGVEATSSRPGALPTSGGGPGWRVNIKNSSTIDRHIHVFVVCAK